MSQHNYDCYGTCPNCGHIGWHKFKYSAFIFKVGEVSIFKCKECKNKFGFTVTEEEEDANDETPIGDAMAGLLDHLWNDIDDEPDSSPFDEN